MSRKLPIVAASLLLVGGIVAFFAMPRPEDSPAAGTSESSKKRDAAPSGRSSRPSASSGRQPSSDAGKAEKAEQYLARWSSLDGQFKGDDLASYQYEVIRHAIEDLHGTELAGFIQGIQSSCPDDIFSWACNAAAAQIVSQDREAAVAWIVNLEDRKLQEALSQGLGIAFGQSAYAEKDQLLQGLKTKDGKEKFMVGYCTMLAADDPTKAFDEYMNFGTAQKDFSGLKKLIPLLPQQSDFKSFDEKIPNNGKTVALAAREALYKRWGSVDPGALTGYLANREGSTAYLQSAVRQWGGKSEKDMTAWVESQSEGSPARDAGMSVIAERRAASNPQEAWATGLKIADPKLRDSALKAVHRQWLKADPAAADAARKSVSGS